MSMISIITVNYNDANGLEETIKSVMAQTYRDYEHIVVDGDSSDGSKEIIDKYRDKLSWAVSEPDMGVYNAMNKGIRKSKGEYLLFLNSGDNLNRENVLYEVSQLISEGRDIYYGDVILFDDGGHNEIFRNPDILSFEYFYNHTINHQAAFIKRSLFKRVFYYNEQLEFVSDWEFFICAICKHNATYQHLDIIVSRYNMQGMSSTDENKIVLRKERLRCLKEHFPLFLEDYSELMQARNILKSNRFKMLLSLEKYGTARKLNSAFLRILSAIFK